MTENDIIRIIIHTRFDDVVHAMNQLSNIIAISCPSMKSELESSITFALDDMARIVSSVTGDEVNVTPCTELERK